MQIESICVTNHICGGFEQVSIRKDGTRGDGIADLPVCI